MLWKPAGQNVYIDCAKMYATGDKVLKYPTFRGHILALLVIEPAEILHMD